VFGSTVCTFCLFHLTSTISILPTLGSSVRLVVPHLTPFSNISRHSDTFGSAAAAEIGWAGPLAHARLTNIAAADILDDDAQQCSYCESIIIYKKLEITTAQWKSTHRRSILLLCKHYGLLTHYIWFSLDHKACKH
jgi:hypothetical protein